MGERKSVANLRHSRHWTRSGNAWSRSFVGCTIRCEIGEGKAEFEDALIGMDEKILKRIRENEREYHMQVTKFLGEKENELKTVLRRLEEKNLNTDGKD